MTRRNRDLPDPGYARRLNRFADIAAPDSPLSAIFARAGADDPVVHEILAGAGASQPPANVLLAAVQYLLLGGVQHPLGTHYPALATSPPTGDPGTQFLAFCRDHRESLAHLAATRGTQTNEVRRCAILVPAIAGIGQPLALIEIGSSAGLNLCFDRYRYDIGGTITGRLDSALTIDTEVRAGSPPVPRPLPEVMWRVGVDLEPIDLDDRDAVRWARALIWPEQLDRMARFEAAVALVRHDPPRMVRGDGLVVLPDIAAEAPAEATLVVFHSFVLNQFTVDQREQLDTSLRRLSTGRPIHRISIEMLRADMDVPEVVHTVYRDGDAAARLLGTAHHHGAWLAWDS